MEGIIFFLFLSYNGKKWKGGYIMLKGLVVCSTKVAYAILLTGENKLIKMDRFSTITFIFSVIAIVISIFTFGLNYYKVYIERKERIRARQPIFIISSMKYIQNIIISDNYKRPENSEISFAKRHCLLDENVKALIFSMFIDTCPIGSTSDKLILLHNKIVIDNIGYKAVYLEIESIDYYKKLGDSAHIKADKQNKLVKNISIEEPLELYISLIANSESGLYDLDKLRNSDFIKKKLDETDGELLNSTLNDMADLWNKMVINILSKNAYGEYYRQQLIIYIENNTYYASQSEPEKVKI